MNSKDVNVSKLLAKLPSGIREDIEKRITRAKLQDDLNAARTPEEIIAASVSLAMIDPDTELEKTYAMIIEEYPNNRKSFSAYLFFYRRNSELKKISDKDIRAFINKMPELERLYLWESALFKIKETGGDANDILKFLIPFLDYEPTCQEYYRIYKELSEAAFQVGNRDIEEKAAKKQRYCDGLKPLEELIRLENEKKLNALKVKEKK